jgi:glycosyltransferase involved in cell wall biosynthesis
MSEPSLSIIIPAFNAAKTLTESLDSIRAQTFSDFEAIIIDDGSTDETTAIARRYCAEDARFCTVSQPNGGASAARNAGVRRARGGWVGFQDADDTWFPQKLEKQFELIRGHPEANFIFTNLYHWADGRDLYCAYPLAKPLPEGNPMRRLIFADLYATNTVLIKRKTLAAAGDFDPELRRSQDWDLWLRIGEQGMNARGVREPMARYHHWPGNNTSNRLKVADANIHVLEKNLARTQHEEFRKLYRRSLAGARAVRELVCAYNGGEADSRAIATAVLCAWKHQPRIKWLRWYLSLTWPNIVGGGLARRDVQRKFDHVCRGY